ncbi:(2Fe-2S)-binding protein [bacterium]|nr:(2Fe-2S)-binding protein [bacterium]MBU1984798.1 (2Fe-2S)-binding protein [bacterium]
MTLYVNGNSILVQSQQTRKNLLEFLREDLDLTGTKKSCGVGVCGSCTILVDNKAEPACRLTVEEVFGKRLTTIEGLTPPTGLHPLQQAFMDHGALQCGFCTPGMILTAHAFLLKNQHPSRDEIRRAISGNLCRCTGYQQIVDAIEAAAVLYHTAPQTT